MDPAMLIQEIEVEHEPEEPWPAPTAVFFRPRHAMCVNPHAFGASHNMVRVTENSYVGRQNMRRARERQELQIDEAFDREY